MGTSPSPRDDLRTLQTQQGAVLTDDSSAPLSFGNDAAARSAVQSGVALVDRSHWGRLRVGDRDSRRFLHNQTTNQIQQLPPGSLCDTVFVTSTGRTLDLATAYVDADAVTLMVSPGQATPLLAWMDRYIFFADKVDPQNETDSTVAFTLIGPNSAAHLSELGLDAEAMPALEHHTTVTLQGVTCRVGADSGLGLPGYTLIAPAAAAASLWSVLATAEAEPMGETLWQQLRIEQGRPMAGVELTEDYNPLEAGLWAAVSFDKGCYIGQETIARLNTYQGVKQQLWGLTLSAAAEPGSPITHGGAKVGQLTSVVETPTGWRGLGYIRTKAGGAGLSVMIGDITAQVVDIPFASRGYLDA
jgi:folate-binding protein YgfZ